MSTIGFTPRAKQDRRRNETLPGTFLPERRRQPERRMMQVTEASFAEWVSWMVRLRNASRQPKTGVDIEV